MTGSTLVGGPVQLAYGVTGDEGVEAAAHRWVIERGAGPFFVRRHIPVDDVRLGPADGDVGDGDVGGGDVGGGDVGGGDVGGGDVGGGDVGGGGAGGRGPVRFDHSSAFGQWGGLMVELIQIHDPQALATGPGLHHVAHFVDSFDRAAAELVERGHAPVLTARAGTTRFAFHDSRADLGHLTEIYEPSEPLLAFYAMVAAAADGWDGTDPVRVLG